MIFYKKLEEKIQVQLHGKTERVMFCKIVDKSSLFEENTMQY